MKQHFVLPLLLIFGATAAQASITLLDSNWKIQMGGFVETDAITDSTRSFNEKIGNAPVLRSDTQSGQTGRETFSIRNSRLGFSVMAPEKEGWKTRGYFEFDLLGYDPTPTTNTEAAFFQNPTMRVRHAYIEATKEGWQFLGGQTWNLLGWQPYYFMPTVQIQPIPGMLYNRTPQFHAVKSLDNGSEGHAQVAVGLMRPPQRDSGLPAFEGGLRLSYDGWSGGYVGGSTPAQKVQPLSIGISGGLREISVASNPSSPTGDMTHYTGHALAMDTLIPVIPSRDGKDPSGTLVVGAEMTTGSGDGDQFDSWTGNMKSPINLGAATAPYNSTALDAGIGGFDANNGFFLIDVKTYNLYAQYHLPGDSKAWISGGWGQLYSDNVANVSAAGFASTGYNREQVGFANVMKDFTDQIRLGFEYAQIRTTYLDGMTAHDNRYQLSAFFIF